MSKALHTKALTEQIAVLDALALEYWSGGSAPGHVWAVDADERRYVHIRVTKSRGEIRGYIATEIPGFQSGDEIAYLERRDAAGKPRRVELKLDDIHQAQRELAVA